MKQVVCLLLGVIPVSVFAQEPVRANLFNSADGRQNFSNYAAQAQVSVERKHFEQRPNTVGTQYLFTDWAKGTVVDTKGTSYETYMNYDKVGQNLYMKIKDDSTVVFVVDKEQIKYATLQGGGAAYWLERVPVLDNAKLYNRLTGGSKYTLYSLTKTKFIAANYSSNGIVSSGNMYDEFKDETTYYIVPANGTAKEISLKRKSINAALPAEKERLELFFKNYEGEWNEKLLTELVNFLNS
ncbi:hypothetical protein [Flavisolibacter ginsenosidimutans]|uniref:DUF4468 domain-containing protein n=1 Tax=Flavisolibacter ginsenosidimutans TaxID=661481 RepID=A0A5B8UKD8_9BACT|nr:hypothetical protein [Flavisolibacter ginsenosidimutans]QEC56862.1 hypothetical protein FSB75_13475 [Flavisolibacter ginsenosidimutans]